MRLYAFCLVIKLFEIRHGLVVYLATDAPLAVTPPAPSRSYCAWRTGAPPSEIQSHTATQTHTHTHTNHNHAHTGPHS